MKRVFTLLLVLLLGLSSFGQCESLKATISSTDTLVCKVNWPPVGAVLRVDVEGAIGDCEVVFNRWIEGFGDDKINVSITTTYAEVNTRLDEGGFSLLSVYDKSAKCFGTVEGEVRVTQAPILKGEIKAECSNTSSIDAYEVIVKLREGSISSSDIVLTGASSPVSWTEVVEGVEFRSSPIPTTDIVDVSIDQEKTCHEGLSVTGLTADCNCDLLTANIEVSATEYCENDTEPTLLFSFSGGTESGGFLYSYDFEWSDGDQTFSSSSSFNTRDVTIVNSGYDEVVYELLSVKDRMSGCKTFLTDKSVTVTKKKSPAQPTITFEKDGVIIESIDCGVIDSYQVRATSSTPNATIDWTQGSSLTGQPNGSTITGPTSGWFQTYGAIAVLEGCKSEENFGTLNIEQTGSVILSSPVVGALCESDDSQNNPVFEANPSGVDLSSGYTWVWINEDGIETEFASNEKIFSEVPTKDRDYIEVYVKVKNNLGCGGGNISSNKVRVDVFAEGECLNRVEDSLVINVLTNRVSAVIGEEITLSATVGNAVGDLSYEWYSTVTNQRIRKSNIGSGAEITFVQEVLADYYVVVTDLETGATSGSKNVFSRDVANSLGESNAKLSVYPTVVKEVFFIEGDQVQTVEVIGQDGVVVKTFLGQSSYDVSDLSSGIYTVKVATSGTTSVSKIIIQK